MKLSRMERAHNIQKQRNEHVRLRLKDEAMRSQPFLKEQPTDFELLFAYDHLTDEEETAAVQKHGLTKYASFMSDMQKKRRQYARR